MQAEDHPLDYADFEGVIPEGEDGAGTVLIWDEGTYENTREKDGKKVPRAEVLEKGHAAFRLHWKKLKGGYALTRFRKGKDESWLLVKMDNGEADARGNSVSTERDQCTAAGPWRRSPPEPGRAGRTGR